MPRTSESAGRNFYDVLGVLPSATMAEVKKAYRLQARRHHPDFNPSDATATDRFKEIQEAYNTLRSAVLRTRYDQSLGFKTSRWSDSIEDSDDPVEDLRAQRDRARAEQKPDDYYYDEPLGPRSDAARAAAEAMRQRIHKAEREGFWKKAGPGPSASTASNASSSRTGTGANGPGTGNSTSNSSSSTPPKSSENINGKSTRGAAAADATAYGAGAARPGTAGASAPGASSPGAGASGAASGAPGASATPGANPSPEGAAESKKGPRDPNRTRQDDADIPPHSSGAADSGAAEGRHSTREGSRLQRLFLSSGLISLLFVALMGAALVALVWDPARASFFAVLAFGVVLLRLGYEVRTRLDRIEQRLRRRQDRG